MKFPVISTISNLECKGKRQGGESALGVAAKKGAACCAVTRELT
jgi:hypothetical protein